MSVSRYAIWFLCVSLCASDGFRDNKEIWLSIETVSKHLSAVNDERAAEWGRTWIGTVFAFSFTHCIEFFYSVWFALTLNTVNRLFATRFEDEQIICNPMEREADGTCSIIDVIFLRPIILILFAYSLPHRSNIVPIGTFVVTFYRFDIAF